MVLFRINHIVYHGSRMKPLKKILLVIGVLILLYLGNMGLTMTVYNPAIAVPAFRWLIDHKLVPVYELFENPLVEDEKNLYPILTISHIQHSLFFGPRAAVVGTVSDVLKAPDGDWHVNVSDASGRVLTTEVIPEYPLPIPTIGTKIKIWGVTRYDLAHRWWELHPVIGWEKQN